MGDLSKSPTPGTAHGQPDDSRFKTSPTRAAPYSKAIFEALRLGQYPSVYLFAGRDAWHQAKHHRRMHGENSALVLPLDAEPEEIVWPAIDALVVIAGDCPGDRFRRLVVELLSAGCRCVVEVRPDPKQPGVGLPPVAHYARELA